MGSEREEIPIPNYLLPHERGMKGVSLLELEKQKVLSLSKKELLNFWVTENQFLQLELSCEIPTRFQVPLQFQLIQEAALNQFGGLVRLPAALCHALKERSPIAMTVQVQGSKQEKPFASLFEWLRKAVGTTFNPPPYKMGLSEVKEQSRHT